MKIVPEGVAPLSLSGRNFSWPRCCAQATAVGVLFGNDPRLCYKRMSRGDIYRKMRDFSLSLKPRGRK